MPEVAEWSFERGGWLQVYQLPERAGSGSFTLAVSNMEEEVARLKQLNIDTSQRTSSETHRFIGGLDHMFSCQPGR